MDGYYGLIELLLVFGIVIGAGIWELRRTRRDSDGDRDHRSGSDADRF